MISRLGLSAALIAATQAILLPPTVSLERLNDGDMPIEVSIIDPFSQVTPVPCVGCPYAKAGDHGFVWVEGVENSLLLNVSVGAQPETLELNGFRLYPPPVGLMMNPSSPSIPQIPADIPIGEIKQNPSTYLEHPLRVTGWSFEAGSSHTASDTGDEVLSMKVHISSLEGQSVSVPDVSITALKKASDAALMILNVAADDASSVPATPEAQREKECHDWPLLCKWKAMLAAKLEGMKTSLSGLGGKLKGACHKHKLPMPAGMMLHHGGPPTNLHHGPGAHHDGAGMYHKKPHHAHHAHHHRKHHGLARFLRAVGRVALSIAVPVMVGIAVGMTTYLIGMLIGCGAAFLWYKLRGTSPRREQQYDAVPADEEEGCRDTEKEVYVVQGEGFGDEVAPPPVYSEQVGEKEVLLPQERKQG